MCILSVRNWGTPFIFPWRFQKSMFSCRCQAMSQKGVSVPNDWSDKRSDDPFGHEQLSLMISSTRSLSYVGWSVQLKTEGAIKFNNKLGKLPLPLLYTLIFDDPSLTVSCLFVSCWVHCSADSFSLLKLEQQTQLFLEPKRFFSCKFFKFLFLTYRMQLLVLLRTAPWRISYGCEKML